MRTPADGHQVHLAPELGIDHGAADHERVLGAALRHEAEAETGGNHRQDPVIAFAAVHRLASLKPMLPPECAGIAEELAVDPVEVSIARKVAWADGVVLSHRVV